MHRFTRRSKLIVAIASAVIAASAGAAPVACKVGGESFVFRGTANKTLHVVNDGSPCRWVFRFGGTNPPDSWKITRPPAHGSVTFVDHELEFLPQPGFVGNDEFAVHIFGSAPGGGNRQQRDGEVIFAVTIAPGR